MSEEVPPVDRKAITTLHGTPIDELRLQQAAQPTGQHGDYIVLTEGERGKGFVRPYRDAYRHTTCGKITTMGRALSETYARDPGFYGATFCSTCQVHRPVGSDGEFTWYEMDGREGQKVGT